MSRWGNSKALTQASYGLVKEHPGMNRWTVRAAVHGALVGGIGALIGIAVVVAGAAMSDGDDAGVLSTVVLVVGVVLAVLGVIAGLTAANIQLAGLVKATDDVLHGRELDEQAARAAAHSRRGTLAQWSAISVAVGALVGMVRGDGNSGIVTTLVRSLLAGMVAAIWAVVTTLVMPVIVLENVGAVAAIKRSSSLIRSTWGEAVFGSVRIGARFGLIFTLPGMVLLIGGIVAGMAVGGPAMAVGGVLAVAGVALIVIGAVKAATCRNVFGVALYRWTTGEGALGPFSEDDLRGAVRVRGESAPVPA
ncbi:MAG: DUF6159 family protein [Microthrixaceae bacterium]